MKYMIYNIKYEILYHLVLFSSTVSLTVPCRIFVIFSLAEPAVGAPMGVTLGTSTRDRAYLLPTLVLNRSPSLCLEDSPLASNRCLSGRSSSAVTTGREQNGVPSLLKGATRCSLTSRPRHQFHNWKTECMQDWKSQICAL